MLRKRRGGTGASNGGERRLGGVPEERERGEKEREREKEKSERKNEKKKRKRKQQGDTALLLLLAIHKVANEWGDPKRGNH